MLSSREFDVVVLLSGQPRTWRRVLLQQLQNYTSFGKVAVVCHFWDSDFDQDIMRVLANTDGITPFYVIECLPPETAKVYDSFHDISRYARNGAYMVHGMCSAFRYFDGLDITAQLVIRSRYDISLEGLERNDSHSVVVKHNWANNNIFFDGFFVISSSSAGILYSNLLEQFLSDTLKYKAASPEFVLSRLLSSVLSEETYNKVTAIIVRDVLEQNIEFEAKERSFIDNLKANVDTLSHYQSKKHRSFAPSSMSQYLFGSYLRFIFFTLLFFMVRIRDAITRRQPSSL
jgi:hypothetical protein